MTVRKKLIEVAIPLDAINAASAREKSIRHGHPSTMHIWWARRPLATARAILFAQLVDDPNSPDADPLYITACRNLPKGKHAQAEDNPRHRLFDFIEKLVQWESTTDLDVLSKAHELIKLSTKNQLPVILDPFSGGATIPLEAQRLGLSAFGSDLNPVAVVLGKASIEIPAKFASVAPVNPDKKSFAAKYTGSQGLAEDVRYYGDWIHAESQRRIGNLYPKVNLENGGQATVIAWLWARTVESPNPAAAGRHIPLVKSFELSVKAGKEHWVEPIIDKDNMSYHFEVRQGKPTKKWAKGTVDRNGGTCILTDTPFSLGYVREQGKQGRMGSRLLAIVAEGKGERLYIAPAAHDEELFRSMSPGWFPEEEVTSPSHDVDRLPMYGMKRWGDAFTQRQLVALTTIVDLIQEVKDEVYKQALSSGLSDDNTPLDEGGVGAKAYAEAISVYLSLAVDKMTDYSSSICSWHSTRQIIRNTFGRQAIPMVWDYAETNPFSNSTGNWNACVDWVWKALERMPTSMIGTIKQKDATQGFIISNAVISTDPPYYDNIGYADLSDYFYVWMRRSLKTVFPKLFSTLLVPKEAELVASLHRQGSKSKAERFFLEGMQKALSNASESGNKEFPTTIYYAFKQSESLSDGISSTGWATFLEAVIRAGYIINGTWPVRSELSNRLIGNGTNVLASSIVLVCRPREIGSTVTTRQDFLRELRKTLPDALSALQRANIAPVDMAQASIGPGIGIFSKYSRVIEADGSSMTVKTALQLINAALDEYLSEQDAELDSESRFAVSWFEQYAHNSADYGMAETLATARGVSVQGVVEAGVLEAKAGRVRLLTRDELPENWDPEKDKHLTVWEATQHLIKSLEKGSAKAAELMVKLGSTADAARDLAYRLYGICERKGWAQEAQAYNLLVINWADASQLKSEVQSKPTQSGLFG